MLNSCGLIKLSKRCYRSFSLYRKINLNILQMLILIALHYLIIVFSGMRALEGKSDVTTELREKFWTTYKVLPTVMQL